MKTFLKKYAPEVIGSFVLLTVITMPFFSLAKSDKKTWYVDDNASGSETGSSSNPFHSINHALDKANKGDKVVVASGTYKENIEIPKDVRVVGAGAGKTTINAKDDDEATVTMKDDSRIEGVAIRKGKVGVVVKEGAKAEIIDTRIEDNRHEGIVALKADRGDDGLLSVVNTEINDNGWSGIYSEKRKLVVLNSDIKSNGRNGVALAANVKAYFDDSSVSDNKGGGLNVTLDGADIYVASKNTFRNNKFDGIVIVSEGGAGSVFVKKSRMSENGHYGVAKIAHNNASSTVWKSVTIEDTNNFFGNAMGNISGILK